MNLKTRLDGQRAAVREVQATIYELTERLKGEITALRVLEILAAEQQGPNPVPEASSESP